MNQTSHKVLLVEDDLFLRRAAEATLKKNGFATLTAVDGEEALQVAAIEHPDLILLDLIMPKLDGFQVLKELKGNDATRGIPVIILSNLGQESDVAQCLELGALAHYVKSNLSLQDLVSKVDEVLGRTRP